jgi:hypothetical protein
MEQRMTTLNAIRANSPCIGGWVTLLAYLGKTTADDEPLSLLTVLESNGLNDAVWCLRTEPTPERTQRFALAVARRTEYLSPAAKALNDTTDRYINGLATKAELRAAAKALNNTTERYMNDTAKELRAARAAAVRAAANAANVADTAADSAAARAANAAACAAYAASASAVCAAYAASASAVCASDYHAAERQAQTDIFKEIFA